MQPATTYAAETGVGRRYVPQPMYATTAAAENTVGRAPTLDPPPRITGSSFTRSTSPNTQLPMWDDHAVNAMLQSGKYRPGMFNPSAFADPERAAAGIAVFDRKYNQMQGFRGPVSTTPSGQPAVPVQNVRPVSQTTWGGPGQEPGPSGQAQEPVSNKPTLQPATTAAAETGVGRAPIQPGGQPFATTPLAEHTVGRAPSLTVEPPSATTAAAETGTFLASPLEEVPPPMPELPMWDDHAVNAMLQSGKYRPGMFNPSSFADPEKAAAGIAVFDRKYNQNAHNQMIAEQEASKQQIIDEARQGYVLDQPALDTGGATPPPPPAAPPPPPAAPEPDPFVAEDPNVYDANGNLISGPGHTSGPDVHGNQAATGAPAPESQGDVFEFEPPENRLTPQLENMYQNIIDMYQGNAEIPYLKELADQQRQQQRIEADEAAQRRHMRGIGNSTIGDREIADINIRNRAGAADLALSTMQRAIQPQLQAMQQIYGQGADARTRSVQEFMDFYDRQFRSDRAMSDDEYRALSLMAQAAGMNTAPSYQPNFGSYQGQPGAAESLGSMAMDLLPYWMRQPGLTSGTDGSGLPK